MSSHFSREEIEANYINKMVIKSNPTLPEQQEINSVKKLILNSEITVYHGTKDINMKPDFNYDNINNDYGKGFYTTPNKELGKEWAYASYTRGNTGYVFTYKINISNLKILNLTELDSLHWLAELVANRKIDTLGREVLQDTIDRVIDKYKLDTSDYDIILGYRADDSYFAYATDFLLGAIYRDTLESALRNGNLWIQVFIKSKKAFDLIRQIGEPEEVDYRYRDFYIKRDGQAKEKYRTDKKNQTSRLRKRITDFI